MIIVTDKKWIPIIIGVGVLSSLALYVKDKLEAEEEHKKRMAQLELRRKEFEEENKKMDEAFEKNWAKFINN